MGKEWKGKKRNEEGIRQDRKHISKAETNLTNLINTGSDRESIRRDWGLVMGRSRLTVALGKHYVYLCIHSMMWG